MNINSNIILEKIADRLNIPIKNLIVTITNGSKNLIKGTYIHPMLLNHIAYWISPTFAVNACEWINEWVNYSDENRCKYYNTLLQMDSYSCNDKEKQVQQYLKKKLKGKIEVNTKFGRIDLLTNDSLIEIKKYEKWKSALGQLIAYSKFYPNKMRVLYLFNVGENDITDIDELCKENNIKLKIYD